MKLTAAPETRQPKPLHTVQGVRKRLPSSSVTFSKPRGKAVPAQLGSSTEVCTRAARLARRRQMNKEASSTPGQVAGQQQRQTTGLSHSAQAVGIPQIGSTDKSGVTTRSHPARTAQALAGQPQQLAAQQDANVHLLGASKERAAGSPEPRVTRSSARAAQAQRRHHPYQRPTGAAAPTAAANGQGVQTKSALRRQQQDAQGARPDPSDDSGLLTSTQLRSAQVSQTEAPAPAAAPDAAHSRMRLRARKPAGRQAGACKVNGATRRASEEEEAGSNPALAAQQTKSGPSSSQRSKRPRDTAETAIPDPGQQAAPGNDGRVTGQPLESAERSGLQLAHPAKRSRRAPPAGPAGPAVPALAAATSRSVRQAQKRRSNAKQRRHVQRRRPAAQQKPVPDQQAPVTAQAAQHLPDVVPQGPGSPRQTPYATPQEPGAAQQEPAPAQPAAQHKEVQRARTDPGERSGPVPGPVTRSKRLLRDGEQQRSPQAPLTEPPAPTPAPSAAQLSMQLRARKPAGRQAGADETGSAARRARAGRSAGLSPAPATVAGQGMEHAERQSPEAAPFQKGSPRRNLRGWCPVKADPSRSTPPTPAQQAESGPSGSLHGKRLRDGAEMVATPEAAQPAAVTHDGGEISQPLESAERSGCQPDLAPEASRSAKRSRLATTDGSAGGVEAAAPPAASASAASQSMRGAQQRYNANDQSQLVQAQAPVAQEEPGVTQQTLVAAAQQAAPAAPQEPILAQQAPAAAQEELNAPLQHEPNPAQDNPETPPQRPGAAQQEPAPAQPAAQQVQEPILAQQAPAAAQEELHATLQHEPNPAQDNPETPPQRPGAAQQEPAPAQPAPQQEQERVNPWFYQPESIAMAGTMLRNRSMRRGEVRTHGRNARRFGQNWKTPRPTFLSFTSRPSDPLIPLHARLWAKVRAMILKRNGGVEPTPGHPSCENFVKATQGSMRR